MDRIRFGTGARRGGRDRGHRRRLLQRWRCHDGPDRRPDRGAARERTGQCAGERAGQRAGEPGRRPSLSAGTFKIGYSNGGGVGNGFREEQVCTAKAQWAAYGGKPEDLIVKHRNTDAAGQASDIRDLIAAGVNAIVFNPNDPEALNPALAEATAAGIKTVSVDAFVTDPNTYNLYNNQIKYAEIGAALAVRAARRHGQGLVHPRHRRQPRRQRPRHRLQERPQGLPEHQGRPERGRRVHQVGPGDRNAGHQRLHRQRPVRPDPGDLGVGHGQADHRRDQGARTSRSCRSPMPTSVASSAQLLDPPASLTSKGAAVTNTAAVGGAGVTLALKLLNGETVATSPDAPQANTVLLDPVLVDNLTADGQAAAQGLAVGARHGSPVAAQPVDRRLDDLRSEYRPRVLQGRVDP